MKTLVVYNIFPDVMAGLHLKLVYIFSPILIDRRVCPLGPALVILNCALSNPGTLCKTNCKTNCALPNPSTLCKTSCFPLSHRCPPSHLPD